MSRKQNKKQAKQRAEEAGQTAKMERHLLKTRFPLECESIPIEALTTEEQSVVSKCINHEPINDDEFTLLKATLAKYRPAIEKYQPSETIEAVEKTKNTILTEQAWLDIVDNTQNRLLKVNVPFNNQCYTMEFEILPLDDSSVVQTLQTHVDLFKDYSKSEMELFTKAQQGQMLTLEEKHVVEKMQKEIDAKSSEDRIATMNQFLASQMRLPESTFDYNTRIEFWAKFPFITKSAIMIRVEERLGLTEQSNKELFPDS